MAKEIDSVNEPSQSSSSLPPLAENEVELVIDRFWRDTRPRACVRSETKTVNGFNFRLLVWPQGSKQSQSHLSAFVEVVPVSLSDAKGEGEDPQVLPNTRPYPPDWACPCVFYRISVMNFKQKYPYSKADTWTFSYVCPDRGWHTLLDTRYINRRDGYLSSEGSLVIRAVAYPRFAHPIPVLPLLGSVPHAQSVSGDSTGSRASRPGLTNFMATDHVNALIQSLFHLPGFRRFIYSLVRAGHKRVALNPDLDSVELGTIEQGLESCMETVKEIMARLGSAAPEMSAMIQSEFISDCCMGGLCRCGSKSSFTSSRLEKLVTAYGRCQVLISCLEESLFSVSQSLFGRKNLRIESVKRTQFDAYRQIIRDCKRILCTVANPLFVVSNLDKKDSPDSLNLIEELQLVFARLEVGGPATLMSSSTSSSQPANLIDTRGILRELGLVSGGLLSAASPDGLFVVMYDGLKKSLASMHWLDESEKSSPIEFLESLLWGSATRVDEEPIEFSHMRLSDTKSTTVEKHVSAWLNGGDETAQTGGQLNRVPKLLTLQLLNKIKDRLDVNERFKITVGGSDQAATSQACDTSIGLLGWEDFLTHECTETKTACGFPSETALSSGEVWYRLHSVMFCWGSELSSGHYSSVVRNHRMGGWTRFDDGWTEELVDIGGAGGGPDWVFSPEWSCSSLLFVREDALGQVYQRSVDVRLLRPDLFTQTFVPSQQPASDQVAIVPSLCNRTCPPAQPASSSLDPTCQVEVCLITEKDVVSAAPGGFSVPFSFTVSASTRKLIVRKDIPVERLMQAVNEHFKIPVNMQRLFALRYYAETGQERFELMQSQRSVMAYMDQGSPAKSASSSTGGSRAVRHATNTSSSGHQLYVFVTASRVSSSTETTALIKVLDEKSMGMITVSCLTMDSVKCLRDYFSQVVGKFNQHGTESALSPSTQFVVFEETGVRQLELKRTSVPIKQERVMNGDILVFVPLTDAAKKALIGQAANLGRPCSKRRTVLSAASATTTVPSQEHVEEDSDEEESLNDRCRRFLSRVKNEDLLLDDEDEDLMLEDEDNHSLASSEECTDECCGCREANRLNARIEVVRRYLRQRPKQDSAEPALSDKANSSNKLSDIMSDLMGDMKLFDGMTREELDKLMFGGSTKRRLEVPPVLRDELSHMQQTGNTCFYCQLPLSSTRQVTKIGCSNGCVKAPLSYHERCARELVLENQGSAACIVTDNCRGRIVVDPKSSIAKLVVGNKGEVVPRMSQAALRAKLGSVMATPFVPQLGKGGKIFLNDKVVEKSFSGKGSPPALPNAIKKPTKNALPVEALWWNACLTAFGGFENLHQAVVDGHWDAADLTQARAVFTYWAVQLLEKKQPKVKPVVVPKQQVSLVVQTKKDEEVESEKDQSDESEESDSSSDQESESDKEESPRESVLDAQSPVFVDSSDEDDSDGFIIARNGRRGGPLKVETSSVETPKTRAPTAAMNTPTTPVASSTVVIPQGFLGAPKEVVSEVDAEEAAASIAQQAVSSLLGGLDLPEDEGEIFFNPPSPSQTAISLVESLSLEEVPCSLLESRMNLLPASVRQYCLPVDLVFVYYSAQFFSGREPNTVSITPPPQCSETDILEAITHSAYNLAISVARLFTSPHQTFPDSPIGVQWFVEFQSAQDGKRFAEFVASSCPEWGPETGALLPASMLGFAV